MKEETRYWQKKKGLQPPGKAIETIASILPVRLVGLMGLLCLLLVSCSDDREDQRHPLSIESTASASAYEEIPAGRREARAGSAGSVTRSWTPPDSPEAYYLYDNSLVSSLFSNQRDLTDNSIDVFLTKDKEATYHGRLRKGGDTWKLVIDELDIEKVKGSYYAYGFIPRDAAESSEIALLDAPADATYADGAVLTIHGLKPVTPSDVCVVIGARDGFMQDDVYYDGKYTDADADAKYDIGETRYDRLRPGYFGFDVKSGSNYLFLLFDHIYSALRFCYRVDEQYDALRTIVLKKVELKANDAKASYDATITLRANGTGASPISGSIAFTPVGTQTTDFVTIFESIGEHADGLTLRSGDYTTTLMGGFVPGDKYLFTLRSTYDVYDKKGNLVRKNCTAENVLRIRDIIDQTIVLDRGKYYTVNLTVMPTYLYVLSEPDLDNPMIGV